MKNKKNYRFNKENLFTNLVILLNIVIITIFIIKIKTERYQLD